MVVVLAIVLLACLGRFHPTPMAAAAPVTPGNVEVAIHDFYFDPQTVTVSVGTNVAWNNLGAFTHTADSDTGLWDSGDIPSGGAYSRIFDTAGTFAYHCDFHPSMKGIVIVVHRLCLPTILRRAQPQ
jgi:plastocyanin